VDAFRSEPDGDLLYGQVVPLNDDDALTPLLKIDKPEKLSRGTGYRVFGMGANFAARRRLFGAIGGFDQVLGTAFGKRKFVVEYVGADRVRLRVAKRG